MCGAVDTPTPQRSDPAGRLGVCDGCECMKREVLRQSLSDVLVEKERA